MDIHVGILAFMDIHLDILAFMDIHVDILAFMDIHVDILAFMDICVDILASICVISMYLYGYPYTDLLWILDLGCFVRASGSLSSSHTTGY